MDARRLIAGYGCRADGTPHRRGKDVNRAQQIAKREQPDGQVIKISNLAITERYLDSEYDIHKCDLTRKNGLLRVFSLIPKIAGKAIFKARWDDGSPWKRTRADSDFDIEGVSEEVKRDFERRRPRLGYSGHHSNKSSNPDQRIYEVKIKAPIGTIFEGDVSFNVTNWVGLVASANATATVDAVFIPPTSMRKLRYGLIGLYQKLRSRIRNLFN
jgi:hypothetical protein